MLHGFILMFFLHSVGSFLFPFENFSPDTRHIFVDVGLGFHVEFTWSEALQFISVREVQLAR
jgi:prefoldin subunit 5